MDIKTRTRTYTPLLIFRKNTWTGKKFKPTKLFIVVLFSLSFATFGSDRLRNELSTNTNVAENDTSTVTPQRSSIEHPPQAAPLQPYPRLLPLQLSAPPTAQAGKPIVGVSISLHNPGDTAPSARLRLIIHDNDYGQASAHQELSPANVKVEVLEHGAWIPVVLGEVEGSVMGAIGATGVSAHRERHQRGGFAVPAGMNKTWQLRLTFNIPGTYSLVAAVSPDNGSRHLAQPVHSIIEVQ